MSSRRSRRSWRRRLLLTLAALAVATAAVLVGIRLGSPGPQAPQAAFPSPSPTPVREVDLAGVPIPRAPFCPLLDRRTVAAALGGRVTGTSSYGNGERAEIVPGVRDVAHEYSCSFTSATGAQARAWVFAAPVDTARARALVGDVVRSRGCRRVESRPVFGRPSVTTACPAAKGSGTTVTMHGLFGDAWFSCQLTRPQAGGTTGSVRRTERWCVRVAESLGAVS